MTNLVIVDSLRRDSDVPKQGSIIVLGRFGQNKKSRQHRYSIPNKNFIQIVAGSRHLALLTDVGSLLMMGKNDRGQIGDRLYAQLATIPQGLLHCCISSVACGSNHTICSTSDGHYFAFGANNYFQCGIDTNREDILEPFEIATLTGKQCVKLAAGSRHSAFLTKESLWTCGYNRNGQCSFNIQEFPLIETPREVELDEIVVSDVACGRRFTAVLDDQGQLYACGQNDDGQLGFETSKNNIERLTQVSTVEDEIVGQVACGSKHMLLLTKDGYFLATGSNEFGQLGLGHGIAKFSRPLFVEDLKETSIEAIACSDEHSAVLSESNGLYVFGDHRSGKLGSSLATIEPQFLPMAVRELEKLDIYAVACGSQFTACLVRPKKLKKVIKHVNFEGDFLITSNRVETPYSSRRSTIDGGGATRLRSPPPRKRSFRIRTLSALDLHGLDDSRLPNTLDSDDDNVSLSDANDLLADGDLDSDMSQSNGCAINKQAANGANCKGQAHSPSSKSSVFKKTSRICSIL